MKNIILLPALTTVIAMSVGAKDTKPEQRQPPSTTPLPSKSEQTTFKPDFRYLVMNANGDLSPIHTMGVTGFKRLGTGTYEAIFSRDVSGCAFSATIGHPDMAVAQHGSIIVADRLGNKHGVFIQTTDTNGNLSNRPFHLMVMCNPKLG